MKQKSQRKAPPPANGPPPAEEIARVAEDFFGETVERISAPGGRGRDSVRLHIGGRTMIATHRSGRHAREMECMVLAELAQVGAPLPGLLGQAGNLIFQEDAGSIRLTAQLQDLPPDEVIGVVEASFRSLWALKDAADETGLTERLPALAMNEAWLTPFCAMPARLSRLLKIEPPKLDIAAIAQLLVVKPSTFVKWDARPGNAAVQPDGRVIWFDWEYAGRRGGPEDFAFLSGDEFWTLGADQTLELFSRSSDNVSASMIRFYICFTALQMVQRLNLINDRLQRKGWVDRKKAIRYDRVGTVPEYAQRLCARGQDWAALDPMIAPMADWFARVGAIMERHDEAALLRAG